MRRGRYQRVCARRGRGAGGLDAPPAPSRSRPARADRYARAREPRADRSRAAGPIDSSALAVWERRQRRGADVGPAFAARIRRRGNGATRGLEARRRGGAGATSECARGARGLGAPPAPSGGRPARADRYARAREPRADRGRAAGPIDSRAPKAWERRQRRGADVGPAFCRADPEAQTRGLEARRRCGAGATGECTRAVGATRAVWVRPQRRVGGGRRGPTATPAPKSRAQIGAAPRDR